MTRRLNIKIQPYMHGSAQECIKYKNHLNSVDPDGYCKLCGYIETADEMMQEKVRSWMIMCLNSDIENYIDSEGQINPTKLAKNASAYFEHAEWINNENHWVWYTAVEVIEARLAS